ncbi:hypothetical protein ACFC09_23845 [Streptomyces sp. NPDC056161]|uniref:hypothetical protein n=1 Tax=Streptomyces sp. NPDC056161 TaxID=3345732 RepID=UPI0035DC37BD
MTVHAVDPSPLAGRWVNFDTAALGLDLVEAVADGDRLLLRITERGDPRPAPDAPGPPAAPVSGATLPAVPLADDVDTAEAVAFLAEGRLGDRRVVLVGYVNRGLLTIDVHTVHPTAARTPNVMYRAHFYRREGATPV